MHSNDNINSLSPSGRRIVADYAGRRGIAPVQLDDFLNPKLALDRCILPDAEKVLARLNRAAASRERVLIFGDYDCDGLTAVAIMLRFLGEARSLTPDWSLPNRQTDHYGLDVDKAKTLFARFRPSLLICLDCGTNSAAAEAFAWLKKQGVNTIVVDHHPPSEDMSTDAVATVNPKAHLALETSDLGDLCAAGLALVLCNYLAHAWHCADRWDCSAATVLAGLGTLPPKPLPSGMVLVTAMSSGGRTRAPAIRAIPRAISSRNPLCVGAYSPSKVQRGVAPSSKTRTQIGRGAC